MGHRGAYQPRRFGYTAYNVESGNLVYLKDFWRVDDPEIQKEGDVYRDDGSTDLSEPLPDLSGSMNLRKRNARDSEDGEQNIHVKRKGLMPPKSREGPMDELSSETSKSRDMLFSVTSTKASSGGVLPSSSPGPSSDAPSSER